MIEGGDSSTQDLGYDFDSLMHYDAFAFSANDQPTITPVDHTVPLTRLGQRTVLSATDVRHIKALYCPEGEGSWDWWKTSWVGNDNSNFLTFAKFLMLEATEETKVQSLNQLAVRHQRYDK